MNACWTGVRNLFLVSSPSPLPSPRGRGWTPRLAPISANSFPSWPGLGVLLGMVWFFVALLSACAAPQASVDFRPWWDEKLPLANPHKGWYHHYPDNHPNKYQIAQDRDLLEFPGMDHLYLRLAWAYLEPEEGRFQWEIIDKLIEKWTGHGLGIAFRISCKETSTDRPEQQYATPRWVKEAGARGGYYRMGKEVGPEGPWEPDFWDPVFLAKLENFLRAFGARYDGKPWVRYVDVGSIGDWGEGHSWAGSRKECGLEVRLKHLELHRRYLRQSLLMVSDDFVHALTDAAQRRVLHQYIVTNGMSYRDDSILVDGYLQGHSATFTVRSPEFFAEVWQKVPTVLELEHYGSVKKLGNWEARAGSKAAQFGQGKTGPDYFRGALGLLRATYIGYHGYAHEWLADNPALTGELLNRCGYWYFPHFLQRPEKWRKGQPVECVMGWENRGVAPAYHDFQLQVRLVKEGKAAASWQMPSRNRRWLPGAAEPYREVYQLEVPANLASGTYALQFKLYSPQARREVLLPLSATVRDKEHYYAAGEVMIE